MGDGEAFKRFVLDEMDKITGGPKYNVAFPFLGHDNVPLKIFCMRTYVAIWCTRPPCQNLFT